MIGFESGLGNFCRCLDAPGMEFAARPAKIYSVVERIKIKMAENNSWAPSATKILIALLLSASKSMWA